ncbi:MAG: ADOP family duplicated permease [Vicinamibacterales bacterium]
MQDFLRDTRHGLRLLARSPIFTTVGVLSLALGIGANAAIFHLIDALTLRSLAVVNPHELVAVRPDGPQAFGSYDGPNANATYPLWEEIRASDSAFSAMFAWGDDYFVVGRGSESGPARGLWVSGDFFPALGVPPHRGRLFGPADDSRGCGAKSVVVSYAFWQSRLGGSESAIGSPLILRDQPFTIVGVTPSSFTGLEVGERFDIALPLCAAALWDSRLDRRDRWWLTIMGRIAPNWTITSANEQLRAVSPGVLDATIPPGYDAGLVEGYRAIRFGVVPSARGVSRLREAHGPSLSLLLGLTALVLLITCSNLATLVVARASARERETAVRIAIGATRRRLVWQLLTESLLMAAAGAMLAVPVALMCGRALVAFLETPTNPIHLNLTADWRLAAFVAGAAALAAVLVGLLPALRLSLVDPIVAIRRAARGLSLDRRRGRLQRALVVVQVAISLVLIFSALLFVQTFRNLIAVDPGFEQDRTMAVSFLDRVAEELPAERKAAFQEELTRALRGLPGVVAAASSTHVPLSGSIWSHFFRVTGAGQSGRRASRFAYVGPGYFDTLRIPRRAGRDVEPQDTARSRRVMVVNESFVRSHLGGRNAVGTMIRTVAEPGFPETSYEIVGVVGDTKYADLRDEDCWCPTAGGSMPPIAYVPIAQNPSPYAWAAVVVRSELPVAVMREPIARRVEQLRPSIATDVTELKTRVRERMIGERIVAWLAGAFGVLAMALVAVGLYGIVAYLAVSRRNEIGIRLSLGATQAQILRLLLRDNLWLLGVGFAIGFPLAVIALRSADALLFGLSAMDGPTAVAAIGLLASAGLLAGTVPAWRAARIRPEVALRSE